jgi:hypothetical protein
MNMVTFTTHEKRVLEASFKDARMAETSIGNRAAIANLAPG